MQQNTLAYKSSQINYYVSGSGNEILFCLHGYGENGKSFQFLEKYLGLDYTVYAMDFPFHGETFWEENKPFTLDCLIEIIFKIIPGHDIKFSLLAYSMGGRAALNIMQAIPHQIKQVVLVAPDGLHINFWYWISTQTYLGNKLFSFTMKNPSWFFFFLDIIGKFYNKSVVKFVHFHLDEESERLLLYKRWTCLKKINPDLNAVKKICKEENIKLDFLFGKYDRIILSKRAEVFKNEKNIAIKIIDAGHQLLREKYAKEIIALLNH